MNFNKKNSFFLTYNSIIIVVLLISLFVILYAVILKENNNDITFVITTILQILLLICCSKYFGNDSLIKIFLLLYWVYFILRMILICLDADNFVYIKTVDLDNYIQDASIFSLLSLLSIIFGLFLGKLFAYFNKDVFRSNLLISKRYGILYIQNNIKIFLVISFSFGILRMITILSSGYGFGVLDSAEAPLLIKMILKITFSVYALYHIALILLIQKDFIIKKRYVFGLKCFIFLTLMITVIQGSRAAFISLIFNIVIIKIVLEMDNKFSIKFLSIAFMITPLFFLYISAINLYREFLQSGNLMIIKDFSAAFIDFELKEGLIFFSTRMNGFDLIIATFANIQELASLIDFIDGIKRLIDTFYPGSIFTYNTIEPAMVVTETLRKVSISDYVFFREHLSLPPMSIVYFNSVIIAYIYLFFCYFFSAFLYWKTENIFIKIIIINSFIFYSFEIGFIEALVGVAIFNIIIYYCLINFLRITKSIFPK